MVRLPISKESFIKKLDENGIDVLEDTGKELKLKNRETGVIEVFPYQSDS